MALYSYEAFSKEGKKIKGIVDASSIASVKKQLSRQELFPITITPAQEITRYGIVTKFFKRDVTIKSKILFTKQLAILLKSGVPLLQAIELLIEQFEGRLRIILVNVKDDIKEGVSLAEALKKYPRVFETIYVQLVHAGEASGQLEMILERLTEYLERREALTKKIRSALQYPLMQLAVAGLVVTILLTYVVPQMTENFIMQGKKLPGPTQFLVSISHFFTNHYLIVLVSLIVIFVLYRYWSATPQGAHTIDKLKLRLPLIRFVSKANAVVQFSYTLGMLLTAGVNLSESLDIVVQIIDNRILADLLRQARDKIVKEGKIAQYLEQTGMFPSIAIYLIKTGEQSGQLDNMLLIVAENYEKEVEELTDRLTTLLGPLMLIFMAVIVGFIVLSVALPIVQMSQLSSI